MNLKHLNDDCLLSETERLVRQERELLTLILHHLSEIERRRLFGKFTSLYTYAMGALGYSKDQAFRRIAAMRMIKKLPEIEQKIESGEINLAHVGMAQALFNSEHGCGKAMSPEQKLDVMNELAGLSTRDAQKVIRCHSSQSVQITDSIKSLGDGRNLVNAAFSDGLLEKIEKLKGLVAHKHPHATLDQLLDHACEVALAHLNPARPPQHRTNPNSKAAIRRRIWTRDNGICSKCGSAHAIQEDHVIPKSMGGMYTFENMRLLCRTCNQREAIEKLGLDKMERYFNDRVH